MVKARRRHVVVAGRRLEEIKDERLRLEQAQVVL